MTISPDQAADRAARGEVMLVDVRGGDEFAAAHAPGARHVPLDELAARMPELADAPRIAFVCATGRRSATAAQRLADLGMQADSVQGGMEAWAAAGLSVHSDRDRDAS